MIVIYFLQPVNGGDIKIGTTNRLSTRHPMLEAELGIKLVVLGIMDGSFEVETALHRQFKHLHVSREWFRPGDDLLSFIAVESRPWSESEEANLPVYTITKLDTDVLRLMRAACALRGVRMQDWLSDLANEAASKELGRKPLKRKPIKPRED